MPQLFASLHLKLGLSDINFIRMERCLRKNRHSLRQYFYKTPGDKKLLLPCSPAVQSHLSSTQLRQQRSMTIQRLKIP